MQDTTALEKGSLIKKVPLYSFILDDQTKNRILVSDGSCLAAPFSTDHVKYAQNARLPLPVWRIPTRQEMDILFTKSLPADCNASIGLVKIPDEILSQFDELAIKNADNQDVFYRLIETPKGRSAVESFEQLVHSFLAVEDASVRTIRIFNKAGLAYTAYMPQAKRYAGLHIDYLNKQTIYERAHSGNRISVNLGKEDRYLVYINLTVQDLIELTSPAPGCTNDELTLSFFEKYPHYPVIKVRIQPGEAYIAPTQNIIHDGVGAVNSPDFHITICGHISFSKVYNCVYESACI